MTSTGWSYFNGNNGFWKTKNWNFVSNKNLVVVKFISVILILVEDLNEINSLFRTSHILLYQTNSQDDWK